MMQGIHMLLPCIIMLATPLTIFEKGIFFGNQDSGNFLMIPTQITIKISVKGDTCVLYGGKGLIHNK